MTIKKIYIYLTLFATLMMTIGGSVGVFMALADIVNPPPYYQSFEQYKEMQKAPPEVKGDTAKSPALTDEQMQKNYNMMVEQEKGNTRGRALNSLIKSLAWIIIPFPFFIYFQRKARNDAS